MAAARRRRSRGRRGASRGRQGLPGGIWLLAGILIGLGGAWYLSARGLIPQTGIRTHPEAQQPGHPAEPEPASEEVAPAAQKPEKPRYDFFTVLPEMEVVVPEQELSDPDQPQAPANGTAAASYLLQVGSFKQRPDAEQMKARLALHGIVSKIQTVRVNDATWHRVRVGPVSGARRAEDLRRQLADNGFESLVMQAQ